MSNFGKIHIPVLLDEVIRFFDPKPNQNFVDCTVGFGGHAEKILEHTAPGGTLLAIDLDPGALSFSKERLKRFGVRCKFSQNNFVNLRNIVNEHKFNSISGILFDLGLSLYQLQDTRRGFSYKVNGVLDMRFGEGMDISAQEVINQFTEDELANIFRKYGELSKAKRIAGEIVWQRKEREIKKTQELVNIIRKTTPQRLKKEPVLSRIFQAIRITVNRELENLNQALLQAIQVLGKRGKIICISYHSLEDRIVKQIFLRESKDCVCPADLPACVCHHKASIRIITKKPIIPTEKEIKQNPKSRSAKMRVVEKI
jgi:16S rRNA (cytosine1402-N4)-methyltransferase